MTNPKWKKLPFGRCLGQSRFAQSLDKFFYGSLIFNTNPGHKRLELLN